MSSLTPTLPKRIAKEFLSNDISATMPLRRDDETYREVETILEKRLLKAAHTFRIQAIELVSIQQPQSDAFKSRLESKRDSQIRFLFHGTNESNHSSIFDNGFLLDEEHSEDTSPGYIGKGVYLSPGPEYSAAYIKDTFGVTRHQFDEPVSTGIEFKVLGCIAIVGTTNKIEKKEVGMTIPDSLDSHWAWVDVGGNVTSKKSEMFEEEYVIREPAGVYPRFRITLRRVRREIVWVDPNITNRENSLYVERLKSTQGMFLFATANADEALEALERRKPGTEYRAMTAGRGGEKFVRKLRGRGITCNVLVFCGDVSKHRPWADKYSDVAVTASAQTMQSFATCSSTF